MRGATGVYRWFPPIPESSEIVEVVVKVRIVHRCEYEIDVDGETIEELYANAVNDLVHRNAASLASLRTGDESWKISGVSRELGC